MEVSLELILAALGGLATGWVMAGIYVKYLTDKREINEPTNEPPYNRCRQRK